MTSDGDTTPAQRLLLGVLLLAALLLLGFVWRAPLTGIDWPHLFGGTGDATRVSADNRYIQEINHTGAADPRDHGATVVEITSRSCDQAAATVQQQAAGTRAAITAEQHDRWLAECLAWVDAGAPVSP